MFVQKTEWRMCPDTWKARFFWSWLIASKLSSERAAASFSSVVFAPFTYAAWCFPWCSSSNVAERCGSSAL